MSKYFDGELLSAYEDLNKEFECKKENVELHQKISDLEAKLAESESVRKGAIGEIKKLHKRINEIVERDKNIVENLNHQLAEKEKEIEIMATTLCKYASERDITNVQAIIDEIDNQIKQLKEMK